MDIQDTFKRAAAGTAMAGALSFGILGVSSGIAAAKPGHPNPNPPGPGVSAPAHPGHGHGNGSGGNGNLNRGEVRDDQSGDVDNDEGGRWNGGNVNSAWQPGMPPGQNPFGPPGQVKRMPTLTLTNPLDLGNGNILPVGTVLPNPFLGVAPGQWRTVNLANVVNQLNPTTISWLPANSGLTAPLPLSWNPDTNQWGVTVNGTFTPYPIQFPAPTGG